MHVLVLYDLVLLETPTRRDKSQGQSSSNRLHTPLLHTIHYTSSASFQVALPATYSQ